MMTRSRKFNSKYWIEHSGYSRVGFAAAVIREGVKDGVAWMVVSQTGDPANQIWLDKKWLSIRDRCGRWIAASMPISKAGPKNIWATKRANHEHEKAGIDGIDRYAAERQAVKLSIHGNMQVSRRQTAFEGNMNA